MSLLWGMLPGTIAMSSSQVDCPREFVLHTQTQVLSLSCFYPATSQVLTWSPSLHVFSCTHTHTHSHIYTWYIVCEPVPSSLGAVNTVSVAILSFACCTPLPEHSSHCSERRGGLSGCWHPPAYPSILSSWVCVCFTPLCTNPTAAPL